MASERRLLDAQVEKRLFGGCDGLLRLTPDSQVDGDDLVRYLCPKCKLTFGGSIYHADEPHCAPHSGQGEYWHVLNKLALDRCQIELKFQTQVAKWACLLSRRNGQSGHGEHSDIGLAITHAVLDGWK